MNKNGFTILEILAVITIIGIVGGIGFLSYDYLIEEAENKEYEIYINSIENAACTYASVQDLREDCINPNDCTLTVYKEQLIEEGYLDKEYLETINDKKETSLTIQIKWSEEGNKTCIYEEKDK